MARLPIYRAEVEKTVAVEFYLAAETQEEADQLAREVAVHEVDWWEMSGIANYDVWCGREEDPEHIPQHEIDAYGGVWVKRPGDEKGRWVGRVDEVPMLGPRPDPNQMQLPMT